MWICLWVHLGSCSTTDKSEVFIEKPYRSALELNRNFNVLGEYDGTWSVLCPGRIVLHIPGNRSEEKNLCPPVRTHAEDWCYAKEAPAILTVQWLQKLYGAEDCFEMFKILRQQKSLEIAGEGASDLTDLNPLFELYNLKELKLMGSSFRYLKVLKTLKNLENLEIDQGAWLRSAEFLKSLQRLKKLKLISKDDWGIELPDLESLNDLKSVHLRHLTGGLKAFKESEVEEIFLEGVDQLEGLGELHYVKSVRVERCQSGYVPELTDVSHLETLQLRWCEIQKMPSISKADELRYLDLSYNQIRKLDFLGDHDHLKKLYIKNNQISDLEPLRDLTSLSKLDLRDNAEVRNLEPLKDLESLKKLKIQGTRIYRIWKSNRSRDRYLSLCPTDSDVTRVLRQFCRS